MPSETDGTIEITRIAHGDTMRLRHRVLRPHQPLREMRYDGDEADTTIHFGAFDRALASKWGEPVGIVTIAPTPMTGQPLRGDWRLRGMAVDPAYQGYGIGRKLVTASLQEVRLQRGKRLWCNARLSAQSFYARLGFTADSDVFDIDPIGPHVIMSIAVPCQSR